MTALLAEFVDVATLRAMLEAALRWPVELLEDLAASVRSRWEHACWLASFAPPRGAT